MDRHATGERSSLCAPPLANRLRCSIPVASDFVQHVRLVRFPFSPVRSCHKIVAATRLRPSALDPRHRSTEFAKAWPRAGHFVGLLFSFISSPIFPTIPHRCRQNLSTRSLPAGPPPARPNAPTASSSSPNSAISWASRIPMPPAITGTLSNTK